MAPAEKATLIEVMDRVLDRGIVISGWHKYALGGVALGDIKSRFVVVSLDQAERLTDVELLASPVLPTCLPILTKRRVRVVRRVEVSRRKPLRSQ